MLCMYWPLVLSLNWSVLSETVGSDCKVINRTWDASMGLHVHGRSSVVSVYVASLSG